MHLFSVRYFHHVNNLAIGLYAILSFYINALALCDIFASFLLWC